MARISTYEIDNNIEGQDKVLGSNSDGFITKNYTFDGIVAWFNSTGAVAINGQNNYFFQSVATSTGRSQGTISFNLFGGVGTPFADITTFKLAEEALAGYTLEDWLPVLVGSEVMLAQLDNLNNFGIYKIDSIVRDLVETEFFNVILEYVEGHGSLELDKFYGMSLHAVADTFVPNLDNVLSVGNTSLLDANIGQLGIYDTANDAYAKIYAQDKNFMFKNADDAIIFGLEPGFFIVYKSEDIAGTVSVNTLTNTRNFELPDNSGTIALTSDIPSVTGYVPYTGATNSLDLGEQDFYVNKVSLYDIQNDGYSKIYSLDRDFNFKDLDENIIFSVQAGLLTLRKTNSVAAFFDVDDLTISRGFNLPDANGTIALTSDLDHYVPIIRQLTINGETYDLAEDRSWTITASGKSINVVSTNTSAGSDASTDYVYLASNTINITLPTAVDNQNLYTIKNVGTGTVTINTTSSQTIDGSLTAPIRVQYLSLTLVSNGANWNII